MTPHPVHLLDDSNNIIRTFESDGLVRLQARTVPVAGLIDGCKITTTEFGKPVGLPQDTRWVAYTQGNPEVGYGTTRHDAEDDFQSRTGKEPQCSCVELYYIVSQLVKSAFPEREDLLVPAEVVRDSNGNIIGCKSFGI